MIELRKQKNVTQNQLAETSNLPLDFIQRIERGDISPSNFAVGKMANALEVTISKSLILKAPDFNHGDEKIIKDFLIHIV